MQFEIKLHCRKKITFTKNKLSQEFLKERENVKTTNKKNHRKSVCEEKTRRKSNKKCCKRNSKRNIEIQSKRIYEVGEQKENLKKVKLIKTKKA